MSRYHYRSLSGALVDLEKQRNSQDSDSLPSMISSEDGMLVPQPSGNNRSSAYAALRYQLPRRRFTRWFTLGIASALVMLAFYLVESSRASEAELRHMADEPTPPPPPAWLSFPVLERYYGGIRSLVPRDANVPEYPGDEGEEAEIERLEKAAMDMKSKDDRKSEAKARFDKRDGMLSGRFDPRLTRHGSSEFQAPVKCYLDDTTNRQIPQLLVYSGSTEGFPDPIMGSYETLGLRNDVCFERFGRLGPYGFGYSEKYGGTGAGMDGDRDGAEDIWNGELEIDYRTVNWSDVQQRCIEANSHRFRPTIEQHNNNDFANMHKRGSAERNYGLSADAISESDTVKPVPRTAVIIRTWHTYDYDAEDIMYLRALINELVLQSGGEYVVHFLVHVQDDDLQIWADEQVYQQTLNNSLPEEFRGMGTLWSERQMGLIYGGLHESFHRGLPVHGVYRSTYMPLQYFAHRHPEYDFFWHWEMDVRYTGHFLHLFEQVSEWAKKQPRRGLWERNSRFYVPAEHGSWEDFKHQVRIESEKGTASKQSMYEKLAADASSRHPLDSASRQPQTPVWGPLPPSNETDRTFRPEDDPQPPRSAEKDNYVWGVGEEADLITFNPLFDPHKTDWLLAEDVTGYNTSNGAVPQPPPRRASIITTTRLSARLLATMHGETAMQRHTMFSEMWPGSVALHHGLKAVYAPHPVYIDRRWPTAYLAAIFNNGLHGAAGGARTSVFGEEREHNFQGTTWYYDASFAPRLWRRWLGYRDEESGEGGEEWEAAHEGRMCLPAMLLHPVKDAKLLVDGRRAQQASE